MWTMPRARLRGATAFTEVRAVVLFLNGCDALPFEQKCAALSYSLNQFQEMKASGFSPMRGVGPSLRGSRNILVIPDIEGDGEVEVLCDEEYVFPEELVIRRP